MLHVRGLGCCWILRQGIILHLCFSSKHLKCGLRCSFADWCFSNMKQMVCSSALWFHGCWDSVQRTEAVAEERVKLGVVLAMLPVLWSFLPKLHPSSDMGRQPENDLIAKQCGTLGLRCLRSVLHSFTEQYGNNCKTYYKSWCSHKTLHVAPLLFKKLCRFPFSSLVNWFNCSKLSRIFLWIGRLCLNVLVCCRKWAEIWNTAVEIKDSRSI